MRSNSTSFRHSSHRRFRELSANVVSDIATAQEASLRNGAIRRCDLPEFADGLCGHFLALKQEENEIALWTGVLCERRTPTRGAYACRDSKKGLAEVGITDVQYNSIVD